MADKVELLQGTLDLIVLRALSTMGPQHAYGLAARLEQVAEHPLMLNQGTLYPALVRLEQKGWIKGAWQRTESNREAKYYAITKAGTRALDKQRSTAFEDFRCPDGHGRYMTFVSFLRAKNFVRDLTPAEVQALTRPTSHPEATHRRPRRPVK